MARRNQHIVPHSGGRAVWGAGSQREAIDVVQDIAWNQGSEMFPPRG